MPWCVLKLLVVVVAIAAYADLSAAQNDEARERTLAKVDDGYFIELTVSRQGKASSITTSRKSLRKNQYFYDWLFEPTKIRVNVLIRQQNSVEWNVDEAVFGLENWEQMLDQELARIQQIRQADAHPMLAYADETERLLKAASERIEDVHTLLRLLHGIQYYSTIKERESDPNQRLSQDPELTFAGGSVDMRHIDQLGEESVSTTPKPAWTKENTPIGARSAAANINLVVWSFDPADMQKAKDLVARAEELAGELTYRPENIRTDLIDKRVNFPWQSSAQFLHGIFRDAFVLGLKETVRNAWILAPQTPPSGLFLKGEKAPWVLGEQKHLGELAPDATLSLPDVTGDRLARLEFPWGGLGEEHLEGMGGKWRDKKREEFEWWYHFPFSTSSTREEHTQITAITSDNLEHQLSIHFPWVASITDFAFSGGKAEGQLTYGAQYSEQSEATGGDGPVDNVSEATDEVRLSFAITYEAGPASADEEPMVLSFAKPVDGKPTPFNGMVDYGDGFYVEGRITEPARREVYRISLQASGGPAMDVFLRPTKDDPTLLRSEILYLMWDVAKEGGAQ